MPSRKGKLMKIYEDFPTRQCRTCEKCVLKSRVEDDKHYVSCKFERVCHGKNPELVETDTLPGQMELGEILGG